MQRQARGVPRNPSTVPTALGCICRRITSENKLRQKGRGCNSRRLDFMGYPRLPANYANLLKEIKSRIQQAQTQAMLSVNAELVRLYRDIGRMIDGRQQQEGWGTAVIPRLARELRNELPEVKGFSERNIKRMLTFFRAYPDPPAIVPQPVAQISWSTDSILWSIPWGHHAFLMEKMEAKYRPWYMRQALANGWSRNVLLVMIKSEAHVRQGQAVANFDRLLPPPQSDLVQQTLKDPYIFDFLTTQEPFHERELETSLLHLLERFLLELGVRSVL